MDRAQSRPRLSSVRSLLRAPEPWGKELNISYRPSARSERSPVSFAHNRHRSISALAFMGMRYVLPTQHVLYLGIQAKKTILQDFGSWSASHRASTISVATMLTTDQNMFPKKLVGRHQERLVLYDPAPAGFLGGWPPLASTLMPGLLMLGLDELSLTMGHIAEIESFEERYFSTCPWSRPDACAT